MRRIRVLMLVDRLYQAGAERVVVGLATHLPRERFHVTICTTRRFGPSQLADDAQLARIERLSLNRRSRFDLIPLAKLARYLRRNEVDIIHSHMLGSNVWGALIGRLCRVPVVIAHEHGWSYEGNRLRRHIDGKLIGRLASAFVAGSNADRERMIHLEGVPPGKAIVVPGAYIPRPDRCRDDDLRTQLGIPADAPVVGTIQVLRPEKALEVLIESFSILTRSLPRVHMIIAGEGECRSGLEEAASTLGVGVRVHFLGMREDIESVLSAFDVAAISSDNEGTSLFALECMVHGVPLVSTDVGGPREFLQDGVSVLLVPRRDPPALAAALHSILRSPQRGRELALAARQESSEFTIERIVRIYEELYERLLREAGAALEPAGTSPVR